MACTPMWRPKGKPHKCLTVMCLSLGCGTLSYVFSKSRFGGEKKHYFPCNSKRLEMQGASHFVFIFFNYTSET